MTAVKARPYVALRISTEGMWHDIWNGVKLLTIRSGERDYQVGDVLVLYNEDESWVVVTKVTGVHYFKVRDVLEEMYKADGFSSVGSMLRGLKKFYPTMTLDSMVTVVQWELPKGLLMRD